MRIARIPSLVLGLFYFQPSATGTGSLRQEISSDPFVSPLLDLYHDSRMTSADRLVRNRLIRDKIIWTQSKDDSLFTHIWEDMDQANWRGKIQEGAVW